MNCFKVDLYDYFKLKKPENAKGILNCYIKNVSTSVSITRKVPAMLVIAGGAYQDVSFREEEPIAMRYLAKGFNAFCLDYSVDGLKYPCQFIEAALAMVYIRKNANELGVQQNMVAAVGFSAGGHLCGCLATLFNENVLDFLGEDKKLVRPDAALLIYPVISYTNKPHLGSFYNLCGKENVDLMKKLSLENCVTKDSSPAFIVSTFEDNAVPCLNSLVMATAYQDKGVPFSLHIFEKGNHGLSTGEVDVFPKNYNFNDISTDYHKWIEMSVNWLNQRGFECKD